VENMNFSLNEEISIEPFKKYTITATSLGQSA
jgi:hypothetical protein